MFGKKNAKKLPVIKDDELQAVASMFTLSWLFDTLERAMGLPSMQNTDGDELIFHDESFGRISLSRDGMVCAHEGSF